MLEQKWTVEELVELSSKLLPEDGGSRRVRWNPNPRLIRYYTTLGLLDRPSGSRGQIVHYGARHLLQLLTVKVLQAEGLPLQEIQEKLYGKSDEELQDVSGLPSDWLEHVLHDLPEKAEPDRSTFWQQREETTPPEQGHEVIELPLQGIELATGMTLLLDRRIFPNVDLKKLRSLSLTLLEALEGGKPVPR